MSPHDAQRTEAAAADEPAERIVAIDTLRAFAIAAVVGLHVSWAYAVHADLGRPAGRAVLLVHLLSLLGVPVFLAVSMIGLSLRYAEPLGWAGYVGLLRRRAARLLPGYLFWSAVSVVMLWPQRLDRPGVLVRTFVYGTADAQLYFVPLLFELYVAWPLLRPLARAARRPWAAAAIAALGLAGGWACWRASAAGVLPTHHLTAPLVWMPYVAGGIAIAPHLPAAVALARRRAVVLAAGAATAAAVAWMYGHALRLVPPGATEFGLSLSVMLFQAPQTAYIVLAAATLLLIAARLRDASTHGARDTLMQRGLATLAEHSYGIFLVHLFVLRVALLPLAPPAGIRDDALAGALAKVLFVWAACLAASWAFVAALSRARWARPLVSNRW